MDTEYQRKQINSPHATSPLDSVNIPHPPLLLTIHRTSLHSMLIFKLPRSERSVIPHTSRIEYTTILRHSVVAKTQLSISACRDAYTSARTSCHTGIARNHSKKLVGPTVDRPRAQTAQRIVARGVIIDRQTDTKHRFLSIMYICTGRASYSSLSNIITPLFVGI